MLLSRFPKAYTTDVKMFQDDGKPMTFGAASFSGFDSSYSLPDNVALLTLQVPFLQTQKL